MNKLILIEGTDCSGKETQSKMLVDRLNKEGITSNRFSYPNYDSPTGKIIAGAYLGKEGFMDSVFKDGEKIDPKVAALYYLADRKYNAPYQEELLKKGHLILDRYVESNMAFQAGLLENEKDRNELYEFMHNLEYETYELRKTDLRILLYMPTEYGQILRDKRSKTEKLDNIEKYNLRLKQAEAAYLEISKKYDFKIINCVHNNSIRTIEDINNEMYEIVKEYLSK